MATWTEALKQIDKPTLTNRDASGIISFARAVFRTYSQAQNIALSPWDWYAFALPALGWSKPGDRFKVDTTWQLASYVFTKQLRASMQKIAAELDAGAVPFKLLADPRGTDKGYRALAIDAWNAMKQLGQEASKLPGDPVPAPLVATWSAQVGPDAAAQLATSASSAAAAAAAPKKTPTKPEPEQMPLPGVPQVMPPPGGKGEPTYDVQPVTDTPSNGGGGGGIFLVLAALVFGRRKKRKG